MFLHYHEHTLCKETYRICSRSSSTGVTLVVFHLGFSTKLHKKENSRFLQQEGKIWIHTFQTYLMLNKCCIFHFLVSSTLIAYFPTFPRVLYKKSQWIKTESGWFQPWLLTSSLLSLKKIIKIADINYITCVQFNVKVYTCSFLCTVAMNGFLKKKKKKKKTVYP